MLRAAISFPSHSHSEYKPRSFPWPGRSYMMWTPSSSQSHSPATQLLTRPAPASACYIKSYVSISLRIYCFFYLKTCSSHLNMAHPCLRSDVTSSVSPSLTTLLKKKKNPATVCASIASRIFCDDGDTDFLYLHSSMWWPVATWAVPPV